MRQSAGTTHRPTFDAGKRNHVLLFCLLFLLCAAPFLNKAVHIDDPLFIWTAQQIQKHPLDFYGFEVNWYGRPMPMHEVTKNPPGASYYLAAVGTLFGWEETVLHTAFLVPALAAVWGIYALARRMTTMPTVATAAAVFTPAFMVSSTTLMSDIPMLALWVWAIVLWDRGLERDRWFYFLAAAVLAGTAALTKYFALSLIPLLLVYSLAHKRRLDARLLFLLIPLLMLLAYELHALYYYGHGLVGDAASYRHNRPKDLTELVERGVIGLAFTGSLAATVLTFSPFLFRWRKLLGGFVVSVLLSAVLCYQPIASYLLPRFELSVPLAGQFALWTVCGIAVIGLAAVDLKATREPVSVLLFCWVIGTFVFAAIINWSINGRSVLPLAPAVGILIARRITSNKHPAQLNRWSWRSGLVTATALSAVLAIMITWADWRLANTERQAARALVSQCHQIDNDAKVWFAGHWGFQYYAQSLGAMPLNLEQPACDPGDFVIQPLDNTNTRNLSEELFPLLLPFKLQGPRWVTTMKAGLAGFYSSYVGPLPFAFTAVSPQIYLLRQTQ